MNKTDTPEIWSLETTNEQKKNFKHYSYFLKKTFMIAKLLYEKINT